MANATCSIDTASEAPSVANTRPKLAVAVETSVAKTTWLQDYVQLTKPRILFMILITVGAGGLCVAAPTQSPLVLLHALIGTAFVAASASVFNQVIEKCSDAMMTRTRLRPLPDARLTSMEASIFGLLCLIIGVTYLAVTTNFATLAIAFATWALYVLCYTPMKTMTVWNTAVGTLPGAMPVLIGWASVGGSLYDWRAWAITAIVVLWQFPHFMAIAWLYRQQYASAGYKMWTTEEASGRIAAIHGTLGAAALIIVSLMSAWPLDGWRAIFAVVVLLITGQQFLAAIRFHRQRNDRTARTLLRSSLLVLPLTLLCVVLACTL